MSNFKESFGEPDEVLYGEICGCNPKNGGSGICGCTMGNTMVPNPKKYGHPKTNIISTTEFVLDMNKDEYQKEVEKRDAESIIEKNRKINILSTLIHIIENEHPEFQEEHTTGWDLIKNAKLWLEELKK